jgi:hypothetical protein
MDFALVETSSVESHNRMKRVGIASHSKDFRNVCPLLIRWAYVLSLTWGSIGYGRGFPWLTSMKIELSPAMDSKVLVRKEFLSFPPVQE